MDRDLLDDVLKSKLHDAEAGQTVPSWAEMQRRMVLHANAHPATVSRKPRGWIRYAAAAAVLLIAGAGFWMSRSANSIGADSVTAEAVFPPVVPSHKKAESSTEQKFNDTALNRIMKSAKDVRLINPNSAGSTAVLAQWSDEKTSNTANAITDLPALDSVPHGRDNDAEALKGSPSVPDRALIAAYERKFADSEPEGRRRRPKGKDWMGSLYANASTISNSFSAQSTSPTLLMQNSGLVDVSRLETKAAVFDPAHMDHKFPVSVGLNIRKYITPRFSVGTGLVYTYLSSKAELEGAFNYHYLQKLHYLGIPLSFNYSVFDNNRFDVYFSAGAMAEFPISARGTTRLYNDQAFVSSETGKLSTGGLLWSANLGAGVGVDLVDNFGIYVEPGVSYYFKNKRQPVSYRTENPWNFNLGVGFRYKF